MQVHEIMTSHIEVIHPDATLKEAAEKMSHLDIGPLPVCDGQRLVGMLTDRDITIRATAKGCDPKTTRVREAMTEVAETAQELAELADRLRRAIARFTLAEAAPGTSVDVAAPQPQPEPAPSIVAAAPPRGPRRITPVRRAG